MANNKIYGFQPKYKDGVESTAQLDKLNPSEFRKGMDYELTSLGCLRLAESTIEEREKATENVLKNLEEHSGYYSGLIQFEGGMNHGSKITETNFKKWLESFMPGDPGTGMVEVDKEIKTDKMIELKEAITQEIRNILSEVKGKEAEKINKADAEKEVSDEKSASKGAKGKEKALAALEKEIAILGKEKTKNVDKLSGPLKRYKDGKLTSDEYRKLSADMVKRNKEIVARLGEIEKEKEAISLTEKMGRREVAKTMMEKDTHMEILRIIKEAGVNLREGADGIKMYYEIAKTAYQEGFMAGLQKN